MAKTIVGELMDLYVKYGGKRKDLKGTETTAEMIDAIEQIIDGGGSTNDFVVTYTADEGGTITADKTFEEITAAIEAGKNVSAKTSPEGSTTIILPISFYATEAVSFAVPFAQSEAGTATIFIVSIAHDAENTITLTMQALQNAQE